MLTLITTRRIIYLCISILLIAPAIAQPLTFYYLGPENGMKALATTRCLIDDYGHFWVTTLDGVVRYNGSHFDFYNTQTHPEVIASNDGGALYADSHNRVWFSSTKGLVLFDEKRQVKRINAIPGNPDANIDVCFEDRTGGMMVISNKRAYRSDASLEYWQQQHWLDTLVKGDIREFRHVGKNQMLLIMPAYGMLMIDLDKKQKVFLLPWRSILTADIINDRYIYFARSDKFRLYQLDMLQPDTAVMLTAPGFVNEEDDGAEVQYMTRAADGNLYMTTARQGLIQYNPATHIYTHYEHDPGNAFSVMDNRVRYIDADEKGNLIITGVSGINYTNVSGSRVQYFSSLRTTDGDIMADRITSLTEDSKGKLWFNTDDAIYRFSIPDQKLEKIVLPADALLFSKTQFVTHVALDSLHHIWASLHSDGIAVFNEQGQLVKELKASKYPGYTVDMNRARTLRMGVDGWMYVGTTSGLFRIDPVTFEVDTFADHPLLAPLRRERIVDIFLQPDVLWVASSPDGAAWKYRFSTKTLNVYDAKAGLASGRVYSIGVDRNGIALAGTFDGLSLIYPDGRIQNLQKGRGIPGTRIEAVQQAKDGSWWLANSYNLLNYNDTTQQLLTIVGEPHLSDVGFQIVSSAALSSGQVAFGVHKGFILVDPAIRYEHRRNFDVVVFYKNTLGYEIQCLPGHPLTLSNEEQILRFDAGITNLMLANKMVYQYRIIKDGQGNWSEPATISQFNFSLQPGHYTLEVRAFNGRDWIDAPGPISIFIQFPWWQRWWVISLAILSILISVVYYSRNRLMKYKREILIARQIGELESKALRAQMNPHFVFNSLNAIQECIVTEKFDEAYSYLSKFSRLLRLVLEHSDKPVVSLHEELEVLTLYISLEKLRFKDDMEVTMDIDEHLDTEEVMIPPMLLQPHIENAIWHGLRHKEGEKHLTLSIHERENRYLDVCIEDNGIGREQAAILKKNRLGQQKYESKGSKLSSRRIEVLRTQYEHTAMHIDDLRNDEGNATGTRIRMSIPILAIQSETRKFIHT